MNRLSVLITMIVVLFFAMVAAVSQTRQETTLPSAAQAEAGRLLFRTHCATCHGPNGRGDGPMADQLRRMPADLTKFTVRNGGVFPSERVHRIIDGRDIGAHGNREMPVWGDVFKSSGDASAVRARIEAIVKYLQGIQERPA